MENVDVLFERKPINWRKLRERLSLVSRIAATILLIAVIWQMIVYPMFGRPSNCMFWIQPWSRVGKVESGMTIENPEFAGYWTYCFPHNSAWVALKDAKPNHEYPRQVYKFGQDPEDLYSYTP